MKVMELSRLRDVQARVEMSISPRHFLAQDSGREKVESIDQVPNCYLGKHTH